jgi:outer membrane protein assembly factor BamB
MARRLMCVGLVALLAAELIAGEVPLGSSDFKATPEHPIGWRGDWTGRYPGANPVTEFGYYPKSPNWGLRYQLNKPQANDDGKNATEIKYAKPLEWLVLGPLQAKDAATALEEELIPSEANIAPSETDKVGELAWKKTVIDEKKALANMTVPMLPLDALSGGQPNGIAYAHLYLYSQMKGRIEFYTCQSKAAKIWINGKVVLNDPKGGQSTALLNYVCYAACEHWKGEMLMQGRAGQHIPIDLEKGWNRVLIKGNSQLNITFVEAPDVQYERKNVPWATKLPNWSDSMPIVVGDKIFLMSEPDELVCVNKLDGKILWTRHTTLVDAATPEYKNRFPQFKELDALAESLKKEPEMGKRIPLREKMLQLLAQVDQEDAKTNPGYQEIYKLQAVLKNEKASEADKAQAAEAIKKKLAELKCTREVNPLYQIIEPISDKINAPDTKPEDKAAMTAKLHEFMATVVPKPKFTFHPCSHVGGIGYSCPTPISDGKHVYVLMNGMGIAASYDFDGNLKWAQLLTDMGDPGAFHCNSPVMADGKFICLRGSVMRAFDAESGAVLWTSTELRNRVGVDIWHGYGTGANYSSSPCVVKIGNVPAVFFNSAIVRVSDGKVLAQEHLGFGGNVRSTPFVFEDAIWLAGNFSMDRLPIPNEAKEGMVLTKASEEKWQSGDVAFYSSPVVHDGTVYGMRHDGRLWVYQANPLKQLYVQDIGLDYYSDYDHVGDVASVALGGMNIYMVSNRGTIVVIEPGNTFKQIAKNQLAYCVDRIFNFEPTEFFQSAPVFDGERMYLRGDQNLYCIGKK